MQGVLSTKIHLGQVDNDTPELAVLINGAKLTTGNIYILVSIVTKDMTGFLMEITVD